MLWHPSAQGLAAFELAPVGTIVIRVAALALVGIWAMKALPAGRRTLGHSVKA